MSDLPVGFSEQRIPAVEGDDLAIAQLNRGYGYLALFRLSHEPAKRLELAEETVRSFNAFLEAPCSDRSCGGATRERLEDYILNMYLGTGQRARAVSLMRAKLDANPADLATVHTMIGLCEELGNIDEGARWLRRLVELEPGVTLLALDDHAVASPRWVLLPVFWSRGLRAQAALEFRTLPSNTAYFT